MIFVVLEIASLAEIIISIWGIIVLKDILSIINYFSFPVGRIFSHLLLLKYINEFIILNVSFTVNNQCKYNFYDIVFNMFFTLTRNHLTLILILFFYFILGLNNILMIMNR